jgi:hypothetical protein
MKIYVLEESDDGQSEVLGVFSSLEKVNAAIEGMTWYNKKFYGVREYETLLSKIRTWYHLTTTELDKKEI